MKKLLLIAAFVPLMSSTAWARWETRVTHNRTGTAQLRVLSTDGVIKVKTPRREDETPVIFRPPDRDDFLPVTLTATDGATHTLKVEMKRGHETVLTITYRKVRATQPTARPVPRFMGVIHNTRQLCVQDSEKWDFRADFLSADHKVVLSSTVRAGFRMNNVELPAGKYSVRLFRFDGKEYLYRMTDTLNVVSDGWVYTNGCKPSYFDGGILNATQQCGRIAGSYRFEVKKNDTLVRQVVVPLGQRAALKLLADTYKVTASRLVGDLWAWERNFDLKVAQPNWQHVFGCR